MQPIQRKKEFIGDNGANYYDDIIRYTGEFDPNPGTWDIPWREFKFIDSSKCKIVIKQKGDKVIAKYGSCVAEAKCHEDDEFDYYTGCKIALDRLFGKEETIKPTKEEKKSNVLKEKDIVKITDPGYAFTTWEKFFDKLPSLGYSEQYVKDLITRYSYGETLGRDVRIADEKIYNEIYGGKMYRIEVINAKDNIAVISSVSDNSVYIIDVDGIEKP